MPHFVIHSWMIKDLKLKGLERDLYAIIYGFTQDGESKYYGSLTYLSELTGYSKQSIITSLKNLTEKNLIIKYENNVNGVKLCKYSTNFNGSKETLTPIKETLPNNIDNNKTNTFLNNKLFKNNNITKTGNDLYTFCINCIDEFCSTKTHEKNLRNSLIKYLNFRLEVKDKPLYKNMWKGLLTKLEKSKEDSNKDITYLDIVSRSLEKGYLTFYSITNDKYINQYIPDNNIHWKDTYDLDEESYTRSEEKF